MGIEHNSLVYLVTLLLNSSLYCQKLNVYLCHVHGGAYCGQGLLHTGLNALAVYKAGNFNACLGRQIGDRASVYNIAAA